MLRLLKHEVLKWISIVDRERGRGPLIWSWLKFLMS
jgi:hypothetical protein